MTEHCSQIRLARASRSARSWRRSPDAGGKKVRDCGPRHAARTCHSTCATAVTQAPPGDVKLTRIPEHRPKFTPSARGSFFENVNKPRFPQFVWKSLDSVVNSGSDWGKLSRFRPRLASQSVWTDALGSRGHRPVQGRPQAPGPRPQ